MNKKCNSINEMLAQLFSCLSYLNSTLWHGKIHTFMMYDKEAKMYRDKRSGFLLHTKSLHAAYIDLILSTY